MWAFIIIIFNIKALMLCSRGGGIEKLRVPRPCQEGGSKCCWMFSMKGCIVGTGGEGLRTMTLNTSIVYCDPILQEWRNRCRACSRDNGWNQQDVERGMLTTMGSEKLTFQALTLLNLTHTFCSDEGLTTETSASRFLRRWTQVNQHSTHLV